MKVYELINRLQELPADYEVELEWESTTHYLKSEYVFVDEDEGVVIIDADDGASCSA
jgi:hypothetical protein